MRQRLVPSLHLLIFNRSPFEIMDAVRELRENGIPAYFTMDAGPNVKVICERENENIVADKLSGLAKTF